jgi:amino acid adenylation domain-containing protein
MKTYPNSFDPFRDGELQISVPTTESQQEIWSSIEIDPNANLCYNESISIDLDGSLAVVNLEKSINEVIKRHDALRATFSPQGKDFLVANFIFRPLECIDLSSKSEVEKETILTQEALDQTQEPFNLLRGPLFRFKLIKISNIKHRLFLTAHHLICDGWSLAIIVKEISQIYESFQKQASLNLAEATQFYEYALKAQKLKIDPYWKSEFKTLPPVLDLPSFKRRPEFRTYQSKRFDYKIDPIIVKEAQKNAAKNRSTFYQYILTSFVVLLNKLTKTQDLVVGISSAAQASHGLNHTVGHLVNLLPIRIGLEPSQQMSSLLATVKKKMLDAYEHQDMTYGQILKLLNIPRDPARIPLVNVIFNVDQQYEGQGFEFKEIKAHYESNPRICENFEIFINVTTRGTHCVVECQYNSQLFSEDLIANWLHAFEQIIQKLNENVESILNTLNIPTLKIPTAQLLPQPEVKASKETHVDPKILEQVKKVWQEALMMGEAKLDANFFAIGGHSLLGVDICHKLSTDFQTKIALRDLIIHPVLCDFAAHIQNKGIESSEFKIESGMALSQQKSYLSINQKQTWYLEQVNPETSMHNLPSAIRLKMTIDQKRLEKSLLTIIENYPALRTSILPGPRQEVIGMDEIKNSFNLVYQELSLDQAIKEMDFLGSQMMNLSQAPVVWARLYKIDKDDYVLFTMFHHIFFDGWCFDIYFQALSDTYQGIKLRPESITYFDYIEWQKKYLESKNFQRDLNSWVKKFQSSLPILDFPSDYTRPAKIDHKGGTLAFQLDENLCRSLQRLSEQKGISLFNVFLSCFKYALMQYAQTTSVIVGIPVRGRSSQELLNTIGYFVNALPISTQLSDNIDDYLKQVQSEVAEALSLQDVPLEKILQALKIKREASRTPLFQTFFSYQDVNNRKGEFAGVPYTQVNVNKSSTHTDLDLWIKASSKKIEGALEYRLDLFKETTIETFLNYFIDLLKAIADDKITSWHQFHSQDLFARINKINQTQVEQPFTTVVDYVSKWANATPTKMALETSTLKLTYQELNDLSTKVAANLQNSGVKNGDLVGLCVDRSEWMLISLLGIMKAGAGYVPLDPYFPQDRLDYMITHSKLSTLLTQTQYLNRFKHHSIKKIDLSHLESNLVYYQQVIDPKQTMYVIYTSGSTGQPKGVELSYFAVNNFLHSMLHTPGFKNTDKLLAVTTLSFDIAVLELYLPLVAGGSVVIAAKEDTIDGDALLHLLKSKEISVMQATPITWRLLLAAHFKPKANFKVLCGGEAFPKDLAKSLLELGCNVWNMYGPTETTVWSTCQEIKTIDGPMYIGRPIDNTYVYVLDENMQQVPIGATGELYIGGAGLAKGYIHREDLTQERFLIDPYQPNKRIYKTGDLARFVSSGELECLGRNDGQVKVRGYRIELGEIEAVLNQAEGIEEAVVIVREDRPSDIRLVAYVKLKHSFKLDIQRLREFLSQKLPPYMIPSNFITMVEFPMTLNGKIDKKSLPPIIYENTASENAPSITVTPSVITDKNTYQQLEKIWQELLGVEVISENDNFFDIGGHSLLAVDLLSALKNTFDVEITLAQFLSFNSLSKLTQIISKDNTASINPIHNDEIKIPPLCISLVPIKTTGIKTALFCFHGAGGNVLNYLKLAPSCENRPLIGVQAHGVDGITPMHNSIEEMAARYVDEIRLMQPQGPYLLAGGSMGGRIALEAAYILSQMGQEVKSVIMFDTFGPDVDISGYSTTQHWLESKINTLKWYWKKYKIAFKAFFIKLLGLPIPHDIRYFNIEVNNYRVLFKHHAKTYHGRVDLFRSPPNETRWYRDPKLGWSKKITGELNITVINGKHEEFVELFELHKELKRLLDTL